MSGLRGATFDRATCTVSSGSGLAVWRLADRTEASASVV